jgi:hypothetical protein
MIFILILIMANLFSSDNSIMSPIGQFLHPNTISSWIASDHKNNETVDYLSKKLLQQIQKVSGEAGLVVDHSLIFQNPMNRNGLFPGLLLPILKALSDKSEGILETQKTRTTTGVITMIEIESGAGFRILPFLYAVSCAFLVYVQGSSSDTKNFDIVVEQDPIVSQNSSFIIRKLFDHSCFELFKNPVLRGTFDFLNAYNLMHIFNPIQHQYFLQLIDYLLKKNGKAFVSGLTLNPHDLNSPVAQYARQQKLLGKCYYGFMHILTNYVYEQNTPSTDPVIFIREPYFQEPCRGMNSEPLQYKDSKIYQTVSLIANFISPIILKGAVKKCNEENGTDLCIDEMCYVSGQGKPIKNNQDPYEDITFLMAVISKKKSNLKGKLN